MGGSNEQGQQPDGKNGLNGQNHGDTQGEFQVAGLVADGIHPQKTAHTAAKGGAEHQGTLRDAPLFFYGPALVRKHKQKAGRIDYKKIEQKKLCHHYFLSGGIQVKRGWLVVLLLGLVLSGCAAEETFETIQDEIVQTAAAQPREITVRLPDNAVSPVLESDSEQVYLADDYEIVIETRTAGDLEGTIQAISGYKKDQLTLMQTRQGDVARYEFVWVSAGEKGDRLGRAVVLDDGNYHYCMSVLRDAERTEKSQIVWRDVFQSFAVA